jgi:hypothetical protein
MDKPIKLPPFPAGRWITDAGRERHVFFGDELEAYARLAVEQATAELARAQEEHNKVRAERDALYRANVAATAAYDQWLTESKERGQKAEAECDALRVALAKLTTPNLYWIDGGESQVVEELCELADNIASDISGDDRECTVTIGCARELPSMQVRVWIDDEGSMDYDTAPLPDVKDAK